LLIFVSNNYNGDNGDNGSDDDDDDTSAEIGCLDD